MLLMRVLKWSILSAYLVAETVSAQVKLPDNSNRSPNLSLDPFVTSRAKNAFTSAEEAPEPVTNSISEETVVAPEQPASDSTIPSLNLKATVQKPEVVTAPVIQPSSPPYSYTLFLDVDYINKFSGGATSDRMSDDPDAVPPSSTMVELLHFYGEYDTAKANLWDNGTFVLHMIYGAGDSPTRTVGDLRSVSNIDASFMSKGEMVMPGFDLLELWYEHAFPFSKSSIRFGVGYLSSDFYKSKYTGLFMTSGINSIGTEILWNTMASNPPNTTLGIWYKTKLTETVYAQAVAFDGFPDHSTKFFDLNFDENEGVFLASEIGWLEGTPKKAGYFKWGFGYWYLSQNIKKVIEDNQVMIGIMGYPGNPIATRGMYTVVDKAIDDQMGAFFKGGIAVNGINKYRHYFTTGITYKGLLPSRPGDTAGVAMVQSALSNNYIEYQGKDDEGNVNTYSQETIYEITYSIPVNKWLMIQPDLQYVLQPGFSTMNQNALVGLLRAEITLL